MMITTTSRMNASSAPTSSQSLPLLPPLRTVPSLQEAPNLMTRQDTTAKCPVNFTSPPPHWCLELTTILGPTLAPKAHSVT